MMLSVPATDPAATILALRHASIGFEVLMVQRNSRGFFGGIVVFPGGKVDDIDVPGGHTPLDDLSHKYAALREFAEETGILITDSGPIRAPKSRDDGFYRSLHQQGVTMGVDDLVLVSRWVTPELAPRRFDTRFYVVRCDGAPEVVIDTDELVGFEWIAPQSALERYESGIWALIGPTIAHLRWLSRWSSIEQAIRSARGADGRTLVVPRRGDDGSLLPIHMPADAS